jgi:cytochrome c553
MNRLALGTALLLAAGAALAGGDALVGQQKAQVCAACHGTTGVSVYATGQAPIIGGQYADYIVRALKDYKSGKRDNPIMKGMVASLTLQDMDDIAAYISRQDGLAAPEITNPVAQ